MKIKTVFLFFLIGTIFTPLLEAADYKIVVGDKLRISVWGNPNLDDQVTVRPDGKISFDLIGEVKAEGLRPLELKKIVTVKLAEFIKDPEVTVKLIGTDMFRIYIMGPLPGVGEKTIRGSTSLMQFLSTMMPIPDEIDLKKSYLIRNNKKLDIDFHELLINDNLDYNIPLQSQDTIVFKEKPVVEKENQDPFKTDIRIVGAVRREGRIKYRKQMTLLDAILGAGGFTEFANPSQTVISRKSEDKIEQIIIDMEAVQAGEIDKDVELKPGDIISVPESIW
jgi:polysaccharide export outer membrane protein